MKKIITLLFLFAFCHLSAQNKIGAAMKEIVNKNTQFPTFSVLGETGPALQPKIQEVVSNATTGKINLSQVNAIAAGDFPYIEVEIPYMGQDIIVQLQKVNIFAEGFHVDTDRGASVSYNKGAHYRGIVKDDFTSVAALNFFNGEFNGIVSSTETGNIVIGKLDTPGNNTDYIVYSDANMNVLNPFNCSVKETELHHDHENEQTTSGNRDAQSLKCVTMYFEIDYNIYEQNNSSTAQTTNWMTSVFNNVQTLFTNDGVTTSLKSMYIWTTPDPYTGEASYDYLYQFNSVRPVFDGDVGQLVGIDPGGLGGVAVTINGLCTQNNFSYSDVNISYSTVPTFSWTVMVVTHEMGHLLGSRHTHSCSWNGNNTAIDNCGPEAGINEGSSCVTNPPTIPSTTQKGSIMSYCHLISGVGISFTNGFGPQPSNVINNAVNSATCLSTDCINTCINTVSDINVQSVTNNSATLAWTELGSQSTWQAAVLPFSGNLNNWITVASPQHTAANLQPNTFYKVRVRPVCTGITSPFREKIFATSADWCNGVTITDTGGATGNYTDNQEYTRVLIPNLPNKKIKITFTSFNLETDYDYLYVYDGASTTATDLSNGGFTGTNNPGTFVSTSPDGALTIRFFSDPGVVAPGYVATVSCEENLATADFANIDFTYYPNPSTGMVNIISKTTMTEIMVYNPQGRLLHQAKVNDLETQVDISAFATGTYFFKLKFDGKQANFKILKN